MPGQTLKHQGEHPIAHRRRQQHNFQVQCGVEHPVAQGEPRPAQQTDGHHPAPKGTGQDREKHPLPEQAAAPPVGRHQHQSGRGDTAQGMGQKAQARQENSHGVQPPQSRPQGKAPAAQRLSCQPCCRQQEQIVHQGIEEEQRVYVNNCHGPFLPLSSSQAAYRSFLAKAKNSLTTLLLLSGHGPLRRARSRGGLRPP